jgi:hypothetical protein
MGRFNFKLPTELHRRFKAACIEADRPMSAVLAYLIKRWLKNPMLSDE